MNIAVNTRLLIKGKMDGIGWFTAESLRCLVANHPEHQFIFFFDRKPHADFIFASNVRPVVLHPPARHPLLWYLFFEWSVARALKREKADLFLSPDGFISLHSDVPSVAVIHDLNFEHAVGNLKPSHQWYMSHFFVKYARHAARIVTVSEFSKRDIASTYHVPLDKIGVVYNGSHVMYKPLNPNQKRQVRAKYTSGCPYFIFVSTILKRKNLAGLLRAFDIFKKQDTANTRLIVVGAPVWWGSELKEAYDTMQHQQSVCLLGRLDAEPLSQLLASAVALVYPSYYEGFGIPILEAFYAETAVITSNVTSMPEVAGDAALLDDPSNDLMIADAMSRVANDEELRNALIERGRIQRKKFSWEHTAELLWNELSAVLNKSINLK